MGPTHRFRSSRNLLHFCMLLLVLAVVGSCQDTQAPPSAAPTGNSWNPVDTELTFRTETQEGRESPIVLLATDIFWAPGSGILSAQVALHNTGPDTLLGPASVAVFDFLPADIVTLNAVCGIIAGPCWYEYSGSYGGDGRLAPGETSSAREWQILNPQGVGFRFRCRLEPAPQPAGGRIAGVVFEDFDRSGTRDPNEPGIAGVTLSINRPDLTWITRTNERGRFEFVVHEPGIYTVEKHAMDGSMPTTPVQMRVVVFRDASGNLSNFLNADFGCLRMGQPGPGVGGRVYLDSDRNGAPDANERGIVTTISVMPFPPDTRRCFVRPLTVTTDRNGHFFIAQADFPCDPPWLLQRGPDNLNNSNNDLFGTTPREYVFHNLPVPPLDIPANFGMAPYDSSQQIVLVVEGLVFTDANENGVRDANEAPAVGVQMVLLSPCDRLESTWTNANGYYRFEPPSTDWCEIGGVAVSGSSDATTTNPVLFPPPVVPGIHSVRADFGVRPRLLPQ